MKFFETCTVKKVLLHTGSMTWGFKGANSTKQVKRQPKLAWSFPNICHIDPPQIVLLHMGMLTLRLFINDPREKCREQSPAGTIREHWQSRHEAPSGTI